MSWRVLLLAFALQATLVVESQAQCVPGSRRPEIVSQGIAPHAVVNIALDPALNASGCLRNAIIDGMTSWSGVTGVAFDIGNPFVDALVLVRPNSGPTDPHYDPTAYATTSYSVPGGGFQGGYVSVATVTLQDDFLYVLDHSNAHCNAMAAVAAHEFGHVMGVGHHGPGVSGYWLMQESASVAQLDGMIAAPGDCDKLRAEEAKTYTPDANSNPSPPDMACEVAGQDGFTDVGGCCIPKFNFAITGTTNIKPVGHIMAPLNNSVLPIGASGTIRVDARDLDGTITRVGWYINGALSYTSFSDPWSAPYSNAQAGTYNVQAAIYDSANEYSWTSPITMTVGNYYAADTLESGGKLWPGWTLVSANSAYYLRLETSGNLVLYTAAGAVVAATGTSGTPAFLHMEAAGNAVLAFNPSNPQVVWQTFTGGHPNFGAGLRVLGNGRVAIINRHGTQVWAYP